MASQLSKMRGGIVGLLVGDALGVPYEYCPPETLPPAREIEMTPPGGFRPTHPVPPGTWSDDGAQALCLLESLIENGRFDEEDFTRRLLSWLKDGHMAVDRRVFDVGRQTISALQAKLREADPMTEAPGGEHTNGNGALMRSLPLALAHRGSDRALARDAHRQSRVTHPHPRSQVACALYCMWARCELEGQNDAWEAAFGRLKALYGQPSVTRNFPYYAAELAEHFAPDRGWEPHGTNYVVDSLLSARAACSQPDFEGVVKAAVGLGNDTDTTACIAGGIAGVRWGIDAIPARWRAALRGSEWLEPLMERLGHVRV